jgi:ATP synthase protein I
MDETRKIVNSAVTEGWVRGGSFVGSILSGMLLGLLADRWLGTKPWLVVIGILVGSYAGFMRMWQYSKDLVKDPERGGPMDDD